MRLSEKPKTFLSNFYCIFGIYIKFSNILKKKKKKKTSLIADVFLKLLTPKDVLT